MSRFRKHLVGFVLVTLLGGLILAVILPQTPPVFAANNEPIHVIGGSARKVVPGGGYQSLQEVRDVRVSGDYAYLWAGTQQIGVLNLSNLDSRDPVRCVEVSGSITSYEVKDTALYLGTRGGLDVYDLADPANPKHCHRLDGLKNVTKIVADASYCYLLTNNGVRVLEITDPLAPTSVGSYLAGNSNFDLAITGAIGLLAGGSTGLHIIDFKYPFSPRFVNLTSTSKPVVSVALAGDMAYVTRQSGKGHSIDLSDPNRPTRVGKWDRDRGMTQVYRGRLYSSADGEVKAYDLTEPATPVAVDSYGSQGVSRFDFSGDLLLVAVWTGGLRIYELPPE